MLLAGFVAGHPRTFAVQLSEKLAAFAPQLTLDFISEVCGGMEKIPVGQRLHCLQYMSPWVKNLAFFPNPASPLYEHSGAKLRDSVRLLVDTTINDQDVRSKHFCRLHYLISFAAVRDCSKVRLGRGSKTRQLGRQRCSGRAHASRHRRWNRIPSMRGGGGYRLIPLLHRRAWSHPLEAS